MGEPRIHHYLPQCYLRGFTNQSHQLHVIDFARKKRFLSGTEGVGGRRDFLRVDADGIDPFVIEKQLGAGFEDGLAEALRDLQRRRKFDEQNRDHILNLIALLSVRSPQQRGNYDDFIQRVTKLMLQHVMHDQDILNSLGTTEISFEDLQKVNLDDFKVFAPQNHHVINELDSIQAVLEFLAIRNWALFCTDPQLPFVTSDHPVCLLWNEPESVPPFYRQSPGFAMRDTNVCFAVSQRYALVGSFAGKNCVVDAFPEIVSTLNSMFVAYAYDQVYASCEQFPCDWSRISPKHPIYDIIA